MNTIRKISTGSEYPKGMHYVVGQQIQVIENSYLIHLIVENESDFIIFIEKNKEVCQWKRLSKNLPWTIEYNIDF